MKKANDPKTVEALKHIIEHIHQHHPDLQLIAEPSIVEELGNEASKDVLSVERGGPKEQRICSHIYTEHDFLFQTSLLSPATR